MNGREGKSRQEAPSDCSPCRSGTVRSKGSQRRIGSEMPDWYSRSSSANITYRGVLRLVGMTSVLAALSWTGNNMLSVHMLELGHFWVGSEGQHNSSNCKQKSVCVYFSMAHSFWLDSQRISRCPKVLWHWNEFTWSTHFLLAPFICPMFKELFIYLLQASYTGLFVFLTRTQLIRSSEPLHELFPLPGTPFPGSRGTLLQVSV